MKTINLRQVRNLAGVTPLFAAVAALIVLLGVGPAAVQATIVDAPYIIFSDDFDNNNNGWTNIGGGSGQATIGTDPGPTSETVWYPSVDSDGTGVSSKITSLSVDIADGPIDVYFRTRVDDVDVDADLNRFSVELFEATNSRMAFDIRPGGTGDRLTYRYWDGDSYEWQFDNAGSWIWPDTSTFVEFRFTLTDNGDGTMSVEGFRRISGSWDSIITSTQDANYDTGVFTELRLYSHNRASANNRIYFDSVAIGQIPEPAMIGLLLSGAAFLWWYPRRLRK